MAIQELLSTVPPPPNPREVGDDRAYRFVEKNLAISLPTDYKQFGLHYGSGYFIDPGAIAITIMNPSSPDYINLNGPFRAKTYLPSIPQASRPGLAEWAFQAQS